MQALKTQINPQSSEFRANADTMRALVEDLRTKVTDVAQGGGEAARAKHTARGKLLPRDRVSQLLDAGTPFLEIGQLAAGCTMATRPRRASSQASAVCRVCNA